MRTHYYNPDDEDEDDHLLYEDAFPDGEMDAWTTSFWDEDEKRAAEIAGEQGAPPVIDEFDGCLNVISIIFSIFCAIIVIGLLVLFIIC